jgi:hypothetical protein
MSGGVGSVDPMRAIDLETRVHTAVDQIRAGQQDEKTGDIHNVSDTDILDWWSQIVPQFDHTPPELVRHLNVQVGEDGEHVVALAVSSDRAPYVVKTGSANPGLEVPMREGTGTRSARRDELLADLDQGSPCSGPRRQTRRGVPSPSANPTPARDEFVSLTQGSTSEDR